MKFCNDQFCALQKRTNILFSDVDALRKDIARDISKRLDLLENTIAILKEENTFRLQTLAEYMQSIEQKLKEMNEKR